MAIAPVVVGSAAAATLNSFHAGKALLALIVALALQVGVNYSNDYSDGIRGTDDDRVGPFRITGSGASEPKTVRNMAFAFYGLAAVAGLALTIWSQAWWLILVGIAAIIAAWFYTGGSKPYGYLGLGEVFVFIFFGLVAVLGTTWTQAHALDLASWAGAVGVGLLACAILVVNNLRDIPGDEVSGKRTLAVRLGAERTRMLYAGMLGGALLAAGVAAVVHPWSLVALLSAPLAVLAARPVLAGAAGRELIPVIGSTGLLQLAYATLLTAGLALS